jgi:hypothetical protein
VFSHPPLSREILVQPSEMAEVMGIEILDFRFKRINYIEELRQDAFARMITANKMRALEIYEETLDFLRTDEIDDSLQRAPIGDLLTRIEKMQQ